MKKINLENLSKKNIILFNKIYIKEKKIYLVFLSKLLKKQTATTGFLPFFSRSNETTETYRLYCLVVLLRKIINKKIKYSIITNSYLEFLHFKKNFHSNQIRISYSGSIISKFFFYFKFLKIFYRVFYLLSYCYYDLKNKSSLRKNDLKSKKNILLLDTTFIKSSFKNKSYFDRFYGGSLTSQKNIYFSPLNLLFSSTKLGLKILKKNKTKFIFRFDFLKLIDYLWAFKKCLNSRINFFSNYHYLNGVNLKISINYDKSLSNCNFNYFIGLLNYKLFQRLSESKIDLKSIISWNENQPADKGFVLGAKTFFKNIPIAGYAPYFTNYDYAFDRQPIEIEKKKNYIPDLLFVSTSKFFKKIKIFSPTINLSLAPLFRFSKKKIPMKKNNFKKGYILVTLPIERMEVNNLINMLSAIDAKKNKVIINFHPDYSDREIKKISNFNSHTNYYFSNKSFLKLINGAEIVISSSSSTTLEAIIARKKIISPINARLLINTPLVGILPKNYYTIAYNPLDVVNAINLYKKKDYKFGIFKKINNKFFANQFLKVINFMNYLNN